MSDFFYKHSSRESSVSARIKSCFMGMFFLGFWGLFVTATGPATASGDGSTPDVMLADFERKIPCSDCEDNLGYRLRDRNRGTLVNGGAEGSVKSARFTFDNKNIDLYFQGDVRRKYLATGTSEYVDQGHNALSMWVKIPENSPFVGTEKEIRMGDRVIGRKIEKGATFNVWTYHWRSGDMGVGGENNLGRATDSNMHGYCNFRFNEKAVGKWVNVVLSPSAFSQARNYYHFYAGRANTDDLDFFGSLRQLQIRIQDKQERPSAFQLDEVKLTHLPPTVRFDREFYRAEVSSSGGEYLLPVTLTNSTKKDRRYRVFISSNLGVDRELLSMVFGLTDDLFPLRHIQSKVGSDGGIGVVKLVDKDGNAVNGPGDEIEIAAGKSWNGTLVYHLKPAMLGAKTKIKYSGYEFDVQRDTLTTSVIVWDPDEEGDGLGRYIEVGPNNADDGNHMPPPGFPRQVRPPEGWRSEDVPLNQVGGSLVSLIRLKK